MAPEQTNIIKSIRTAIDDYAEFPTEDLQEAVLNALGDLDTDLTESGYQQSSRADAAAAAIENAMNEADAVVKDEETETE